jgi:DNA invertase Pin-like site-specific DNA recombinase
MTGIIYSRCSLTIQDYDRQTAELSEFAFKSGIEIVGVFEEKVSGAKINRPEFLSMVDRIKTEKIDFVLCWELSRLGRNSLQVMEFIETLHQHQVCLYIHNIGLYSMQKGKVNPMASFMVNILSSVAELERTSIRARMKSGYDYHRQSGGRVGRQQGQVKDKETFMAENRKVVQLIQSGHSVRNVAKICDKSPGLVQKVRKMLQDEKKI